MIFFLFLDPNGQARRLIVVVVLVSIDASIGVDGICELVVTIIGFLVKVDNRTNSFKTK